MSKPRKSLTLKRLNFDLRRELRSGAAHRCLSESGWGDVGWSDGGCLVLAQSLLQWLGEGEVWGVWEVSRGEETQHHAVLKVGEWFLDEAGIASREELLSQWNASLFERPGVPGWSEVRPFDWDDAHEGGIESNCNAEDSTVRFLSRRFNATAFLQALKDGA